MITIQDFINKQQRRLEILKNSDEAVFLAASTVHAAQVERIFTEGVASNNAKIGSYDTTDPLYVNPKDAPKKFTGQGKYGDKKHKDGAAYKTRYFSSYAAFRQNQGRKTDTVNLDLFGRLKTEYENGLQRGESGAFVSRLTTKESQQKAIGNQYKFKKGIFSLTQDERDLYTDTLAKELNRLLNA